MARQLVRRAQRTHAQRKNQRRLRTNRDEGYEEAKHAWAQEGLLPTCDSIEASGTREGTRQALEARPRPATDGRRSQGGGRHHNTPSRRGRHGAMARRESRQGADYRAIEIHLSPQHVLERWLASRKQKLGIREQEKRRGGAGKQQKGSPYPTRHETTPPARSNGLYLEGRYLPEGQFWTIRPVIQVLNQNEHARTPETQRISIDRKTTMGNPFTFNKAIQGERDKSVAAFNDLICRIEVSNEYAGDKMLEDFRCAHGLSIASGNFDPETFKADIQLSWISARQENR